MEEPDKFLHTTVSDMEGASEPDATTTSGHVEPVQPVPETQPIQHLSLIHI